MSKFLWAYAGAAIVFVAADFVWLGFVARDFYRNNLGELMLERPLMSVAVAFYVLYLVGVVIFGVSPALREGSWWTAAMYGALFGFFAYATYDLTNLATLRNWPPIVTVVDMAWGVFVSAVASTAGYALATRMSD